jgi:hypothetical protein
MTPVFDRRREHGSITPPYHGAMFEQNGNYFAGDGRFLFGPDGPQASAKQAEAPKAPEPQIANPGPAAAETDGIDLAAWAKREKNYPFFAVKKEVQAKFPQIDTKTASSIANGLAAAGVVAKSEVKR